MLGEDGFEACCWRVSIGCWQAALLTREAPLHDLFGAKEPMRLKQLEAIVAGLHVLVAISRVCSGSNGGAKNPILPEASRCPNLRRPSRLPADEALHRGRGGSPF